MRFAAALTLLLASAWAAAAEAPVAQVETVPLRQELLSDTVWGYGVVEPDTSSLDTLSLPRPGQIVRLLVNAGQVVRKGSALLEFSTGADAARGYQQARQAVDFASGELARIEELRRQQLATQSQVETAKKALADARAALAAQERIGAGRASERVAAPFDGVVIALLAAQGDRVAAGAPVLKLARAGGQRLVVGIEPDDVRRVRPGMTVTVAPVFAPGHVATGRVTQVFGMINPQTQFVDVLVEVRGDGLLAGTRARADIEIERTKAWVVPRSAVLRDKQGAYVFQVRGGRARRVDVQSGLEKGGLVAVQGALATDEPVVSVGNYVLRDGMSVRTGGR